LTLQQELIANVAATATYSGSRGVNLPRVGDANRPPISQDADGRWFYPDPGADRANDNFSDVTLRRWDANSNYHALKLGLRRRFSGGTMFQLAYQWQKSIDDGSGVAGSPRETFNDAWLSQNILDRSGDRGLSSFSIEHTFSANWGVELPFGPGRRFGAGADGIVGKLIEGWQINGIVQLVAGAPQFIEGNPNATCTQCSNINATIKEGFKVPKSEDPNGWFIADIATISEEDFPFTQPGQPGALPAGYFGNLARNAGEGPGVATLDFSILKNFAVGEEVELQFRAEFFNILNRTNFQGPIRSRSTFSRGGSITRTFGELLETATTSRQIQFALKIVF
jgi:hypothetical protein